MPAQHERGRFLRRPTLLPPQPAPFDAEDVSACVHGAAQVPGHCVQRIPQMLFEAVRYPTTRTQFSSRDYIVRAFYQGSTHYCIYARHRKRVSTQSPVAETLPASRLKIRFEGGD